MFPSLIFFRKITYFTSAFFKWVSHLNHVFDKDKRSILCRAEVNEDQGLRVLRQSGTNVRQTVSHQLWSWNIFWRGLLTCSNNFDSLVCNYFFTIPLQNHKHLQKLHFVKHSGSQKLCLELFGLEMDLRHSWKLF